MEAVLLISAIILLALGFLGTFLPVLPGPPLAWSALLLEYFMESSGMTVTLLVITFIVAVVVTIMDFAFPTIQTKKSGGTKYGTWGSTIGLIVGLFSGPFRFRPLSALHPAGRQQSSARKEYIRCR